MILAASHIVIATNDVTRLVTFFKDAFRLTPHFENEMFAEFVLSSQFRIAFFRPVGKAGESFSATADRAALGIGLTVKGVDEIYARLEAGRERWQIALSGPPKEHSWGEKSFLLTDPDGNRWEIAESPSADGMLVNRPHGSPQSRA